MSNRLITNFIDLARISSPSGQEGNLRSELILQLKNLGFKTLVDRAGNLLGRRVGSSSRWKLVCAHMDTVDPCQNIKPVIKRNYITSSGNSVLGADNKSSIAAILEAVSNASTRHQNIEVLFTVREETTGGIREFDTTQLKSKSGLIADRAAPLGTIVMASPWLTDLKFTIKGKSAHAASPEQGLNAIVLAAKLIDSMPVGRVDPDTTLNIGTIFGGSGSNTVPDLVEIKGELRSFKKSSHVKLLAKLKKLESRHSSVAFYPYCDGYQYSKSDPIVREVVGCLDSLSVPVTYATSLGASDANSLINSNITVVNIGYGAEFTHTIRERIKIRDLEKLSKIFEAYLISPGFVKLHN